MEKVENNSGKQLAEAFSQIPLTAIKETRSPELGKLFTALAKVQGELGPAIKNAKGVHGSMFADLAECLNTIYPITSKNGISFIQLPCRAKTEGYLALKTMMCHDSGQFIETTLEMKPKDMTAWEVGSGISYLRRYTVSACVGLSQSDDDGNKAQGEPFKKKATIKEAKADKEKYLVWFNKAKNLTDLNKAMNAIPEDVRAGYMPFYDKLADSFGAKESTTEEEDNILSAMTKE